MLSVAIETRMNTMIRIAQSGLAGARTQTDGIHLFERGSGGKVIDVNGKEYLDFILGYGAVVLGHSHTGHYKRLSQYEGRGNLLPGYSPFHIELLERLFGQNLTEHAGAFFKTASEAVTAAIRLACHVTHKLGVVRCGFIGWHDAQIGMSIRWHERINSPLRYDLRCVGEIRGISGNEMTFNWTSLQEEELEAILDQHGDMISCFVLDTYQLAFTTAKTIERAIHLCRKRGLKIIADETKIAGRVNHIGFASQLGWDVDFIVAGKALANGLPLSILLGRSDYMEYSERARITGTFSHELGSVFSALATLDEIEARGGFEILPEIGRKVVQAFNLASSDAGVSDSVFAEPMFGGSMFELLFSDNLLSNWQVRQNLCSKLSDEGVLALQGHASYVCTDHDGLDFPELRSRFLRCLDRWKCRDMNAL